MAVHHDADGALKVAARLYKDNDTLGAINLYNEFSIRGAGAVTKRMCWPICMAPSPGCATIRDALQILYELFQRAGEDSMIAEVLELLAHACVQVQPVGARPRRLQGTHRAGARECRASPGLSPGLRPPQPSRARSLRGGRRQAGR